MNKKNTFSSQLVIRVSDDLYELVSEIARERGVKPSKLVRSVLAEQLSKQNAA